eukprot:GCRY01004969.1.p1 GENE.GCRY01004969.1~~GCRY01004969.1.p1  ORF type:complete len:336 (+),score=79.70 GCRY01004969.1:132-1139(+)
MALNETRGAHPVKESLSERHPAPQPDFQRPVNQELAFSYGDRELEKLVEIALSKEADDEKKINALQMLEVVLVNQGAAHRACERAAVTGIIALCTKKNPPVQKAAAHILSALATSARAPQVFFECQAYKCLSELIVSTSPDVMMPVAAAMEKITEWAPAIEHVSLAETTFIPNVVKALKEPTIVVQVPLLLTLVHITQNSETAVAIVLDSGGLSRVADIFTPSAPQPVLSSTLSLLRNLSRSFKGKRSVVDAGLIPILGTLLTHYSSEIKMLASGALALCCVDESGKIAAADCPALVKNVQKLLSDANGSVMQNAILIKKLASELPRAKEMFDSL